MKKYLLVFLSFIFTVLTYSQSAIPELSTTGNEISDLVPKGWKMLSSTTGDLNKDGKDDLVFAIQNTAKENFELSEGLGVDTVDLNPRILAIYFCKADGTLEKKLQSNEFILLKDSPTMDEPFDNLQILKNGVLQIDFHFWYSAGSWFMSNHQYKFRFQNNSFELIGYDSSERHRASGETTDYSINFLSKKMNIIRTTFDENEKEHSTEEWKNFELKKLKSIKSLGKPFQWQFQEIYL